MFRLYLKRNFIFMMVAAICYLLVRGVSLRRKKQPFSLKKELPFFLLTVYLSTLAFNLIVPDISFGQLIDGKFMFDLYFPKSRMYNLIPFQTIRQQMNMIGSHQTELAVVNLMMNLLIFLPFYPLLMLCFPKQNQIKMIGIACLFGILAEVIQLFIGRSCDIDDVILYVCSIGISVLCWIPVERMIQKIEMKGKTKSIQ